MKFSRSVVCIAVILPFALGGIVKRIHSCGQSMFTNDQGTIYSHSGFTEHHNYGKNLDCGWTIVAPKGKYVKLEAVSFDVEDDVTCSFDYLALYDGNSTAGKEIGRYCGSSFNTVTSRGNVMLLEFITDDSDQRAGFELSYSFTDTIIVGCPNGQFHCDNNRCIDSSYQCDKDDDCGDDSDEQNCVYTTPGTGKGGCSASDFRCLTSNDCIPQDWKCDGDDDCIDASDETNCAAVTKSPECGATTRNGTSGRITSPNYPNDYGNDENCRWTIHVTDPNSQGIEFHFNNLFSIEAGDDATTCDYDRLIIYAASNPLDRHGPFCANTAPTTFSINTSDVVVEFKTDTDTTFMGFSLDWKAKTGQINNTNETACDTTVNYTVPGIITNPGYNGKHRYLPYTECTWTIVVPDDKVLRLHFNDFYIQPSKSCKGDKFEVYDGPKDHGKVIEKLCGNVAPPDVTSTRDHVTIFFLTDGHGEDLGFNLTYYAVDPEVHHINISTDVCNGTTQITNRKEGEITTPNYDGYEDYPPNLECSWTIRAPPGQVVTLTFTDLDIEQSEGCTFDYLEVTDGTDNHTYCGMVFPPEITSTGSSMSIHFHSDHTVAGPGFRVLYKMHNPLAPCFGFRCEDNSCIHLNLVCNGVKDCAAGSDELICGNDPHCGRPAISPAKGNHRIVGGREAIPNSWPWQVSLKLNGSHVCGGSLIHPLWVVTAAHCFEGDRVIDLWVVEAGRHHESKPVDQHVQARNTSNVIVHGYYDPDTSDNDIALMKLETPMHLNDYVSTVCLPTILVDVGELCYVTGWGDIQGTCCPGVLKQAAMPVWNSSECNEEKYLDGVVTSNMICASFEKGGLDTCQGDSGGPFVCNIGKRWQLEGITSYGYGCADAKSPGIYTKLINYVHWVQQKVALH